MVGSRDDDLRDPTMTVVHRVGFVGAAVVLWAVVFLVVRASTESTTDPCLDTVVIEASAACAVPPPSLLPAIPVATAVLLVAIGGALVVRRQSRLAASRLASPLQQTRPCRCPR